MVSARMVSAADACSVCTRDGFNFRCRSQKMHTQYLMASSMRYISSAANKVSVEGW